MAELDVRVVAVARELDLGQGLIGRTVGRDTRGGNAQARGRQQSGGDR